MDKIRLDETWLFNQLTEEDKNRAVSLSNGEASDGKGIDTWQLAAFEYSSLRNHLLETYPQYTEQLISQIMIPVAHSMVKQVALVRTGESPSDTDESLLIQYLRNVCQIEN